MMYILLSGKICIFLDIYLWYVFDFLIIQIKNS